MTINEVTNRVASEMEAITDPVLAARAEKLRTLPREKKLVWEYGNNEEHKCWLVANLGERDVWAAYCSGGHGEFGSPWGLVFEHKSEFGQDCCWCRSLRELFEEWFA